MKNKDLRNPPKESIIYQDNFLSTFLASYPITKGHSIVALRDEVSDIHLLDRAQYERLMDIVDATRNALLQTLGVEKVYLVYADEAKHVHWHLVPRYDEKGFNILAHEPKLILDFSLTKEIKKNLKLS